MKDDKYKKICLAVFKDWITGEFAIKKLSMKHGRSHSDINSIICGHDWIDDKKLWRELFIDKIDEDYGQKSQAFIYLTCAGSASRSPIEHYKIWKHSLKNDNKDTIDEFEISGSSLKTLLKRVDDTIDMLGKKKFKQLFKGD